MDTAETDRLTNLEIKLSFLDDTVDELNRVIIRQQRTLDLLIREVTDLKARLEAGSPQAGSGALDATARALHERPPHY